MSNRSAWIFLIGSTMLAVVLAVGLIGANLRPAPDLGARSTSDARAEALGTEIATEVESRLGEGWNASAELEEVERYRGRFGLPAWQADYSITLTADGAPRFSQTVRTSRSLGPGAGSIDSAAIPDDLVYATIGALPSDRRVALLNAIAAELDNAPLLIVEPLTPASGTRPWAESGTPNRELVSVGRTNGVDTTDLLVIGTSREPKLSLWGWTGSGFRPLARLDESTAEPSAW